MDSNPPAHPLPRSEPPATDGIVGTGPWLDELRSSVRDFADSGQSVLITGETGTGKELAARALHRASGRANLVPVSCGGLSESLIQTELFGHVRGAFTGADREREGLFQAAHGGTLFLDEAGELPPHLQATLLRALDTGEVRPLGGTRSRRVDVRVLAATHRDLEEEVARGRFREDLYWRLRPVRIHLPPLRERPGDVIPLARYFGAPSELSAEVEELLVARRWPGNVRQLRDTISYARARARSGTLRVEHLPPELLRTDADGARGMSGSAELLLSRAEVIRTHTEYVLEVVGRSNPAAARILGIDVTTLRRNLATWQRADAESEERG